jgi:hypothetical protein
MTVERMKRPWSVVGAGFNDDGVYFTFDDTTIHRGDVRLMEAAPDLLEALQDMLSGWKYIREQHGDLYGVGWDRAQDKATAAISKALGEE